MLYDLITCDFSRPAPTWGGVSGVVITTSAGCMGSAPPDGRRRAPHAALVSPGASGAPPPSVFGARAGGSSIRSRLVDKNRAFGRGVFFCWRFRRTAF